MPERKSAKQKKMKFSNVVLIVSAGLGLGNANDAFAAVAPSVVDPGPEADAPSVDGSRERSSPIPPRGGAAAAAPPRPCRPRRRAAAPAASGPPARAGAGEGWGGGGNAGVLRSRRVVLRTLFSMHFRNCRGPKVRTNPSSVTTNPRWRC